MNNTSINIFEPRVMIQMLNQMLPTRTFFKTTFFNNITTVTSDYVDIDIRKGKRRLAPFVSEKVGSKTVDRAGFTTETYRPPLIAPDMITIAEDIKNRIAGENIYGAMDPNARMGQIMRHDLEDLDEQISRREEWMCAQVLLTGKIPMQGDGIDQELDLSEHWHFVDLTKDADRSWDNLDADIGNQLIELRRKVSENSGLTANIAILGSNAVTKLRANTKWREEQKFYQTKLGEYNPKIEVDGIIFIGHYMGIELYSYDEWYLDEFDLGLDGKPKSKPMMDPNKIIMASTKVYTSFIYGVVYDVDNGSFALPRVPKSWTEKKPSARFLQLSSRPIPIPTQIDGFLTVTVCTGNMVTVKEAIKTYSGSRINKKQEVEKSNPD